MAPAKKTPAASTSATPGKATKKAVKAVEAKPAVEETPAVPVVEVPAETDATTAAPVVATPASMEAMVAEISAHFQAAEKEVRAGKMLLKKLHQLHNKEMKAAAVAMKHGARRKRERDPNAPKRAPSGIAKPAKISPELATFLKVDPNTELARTEVIKMIAVYIKANSLENPSNRRQIVPNSALAELLKVDKTADLSYFSLQKHLRPHFPKALIGANSV